jgi:DMSO/TMAO reductase YedYZ molybdopterin-dependent catalytic subunit
MKDSLTQGPFHTVLTAAERLNHGVIGTRGMAKLYTEADIDHDFRVNGNDAPADATYNGLAKDGFRRYTLIVDGLADHPQAFSLAALRAMPLQTQITRHDCVEGWSVIGKWRGVRLADVLAAAQPKATARYAIFSCYDRDEQGSPYYESLDLVEAAHPQTLLALDLNDTPLDHDHGAPVRLRIPTQLGYKSAKWVHRIQLAATFAGVGDGKGGYWEDQGYEWYAGI